MRMQHSFVHRLQVGFAALVVTTLLVLAAILVAERRVGSALERSADALALLDDFKEVRIQFSAARAAEREFLVEGPRSPSFFQHGDSPALERHRQALTELRALLDRLEREERGVRVQAEAVRKEVDLYAEAFAELVSLYRERGFIYSGLIEEMRRATFAFQDQIETLPESSQNLLHAELLELIRDQGEYLRDLATRPRFLVSERLKVIREEIDALEGVPRAPLTAEIARYEKAWSRVLEIDDRIGGASEVGLRGTLGKAHETVVPLTLTAVEQARAGFMESQRAVHSAQETARLTSAGLATVAVVMALLIAVSLRTQVQRSLAAVLRAVETYAGGDRSARVGTLARRDEFAVLGESFDHMAETLMETTDELEEINASLELAIKGDTTRLLETIKTLVAARGPST